MANYTVYWDETHVVSYKACISNSIYSKDEIEEYLEDIISNCEEITDCVENITETDFYTEEVKLIQVIDDIEEEEESELISISKEEYKDFLLYKKLNG